MISPFEMKRNKSIASDDVPNSFTLAFVYELPIGKGQKFLNHGGIVNAVVGGWKIGAIQTYESAMPISINCKAPGSRPPSSITASC